MSIYILCTTIIIIYKQFNKFFTYYNIVCSLESEVAV